MDTIQIQLLPPDPTEIGIVLQGPDAPILTIEINKLGAQGVAGNGSSNEIKNEMPIGLMNGSNAVFNTLNNFVPESVEVFLGGIKMQPISDYYTTGNLTIHMVTSPFTGENLLINYTKL